jgi:hypothetical protein
MPVRRGRRDGLRKNIGEALRKSISCWSLIMLLVVVDLQHAVGLVVAIPDDDVDGRDDTLFGIERRQLEIVVAAKNRCRSTAFR